MRQYSYVEIILGLGPVARVMLSKEFEPGASGPPIQKLESYNLQWGNLFEFWGR